MKKICFVVADPRTAGFLVDHMRALSQSYDITLVANFAGDPPELPFSAGLQLKTIVIERNIRVFADVRALLALILFFREQKFAAVHSVTPKAGLLSMLAARMVRVPQRFHTFTGQVWVTRKGFFRAFLRQLDRVLFACSTHVLVDSPSQRQFLLDESIITSAKSSVLGDGSICGVDVRRFRPDATARSTLRSEWGVPSQGFVFLFAGRINRDKGVGELIQAFAGMEYARHQAYLLLLGGSEDDILQELDASLQKLGRHVIRKDWTDKPEAFMAAADVFCLPSHREGFGSVIIEAAACGLPAVGSRIYGITDAIEDGATGLLHEAGNVRDLQEKMNLLLDDRSLVARLSKQAKDRAYHRFAVQRVVEEMCSFYRERI